MTGRGAALKVGSPVGGEGGGRCGERETRGGGKAVEGVGAFGERGWLWGEGLQG